MDPRGKITDFEAASSYQLLASSFAVLAHAWCTSLQHLGAARIWKDQNDLSQLNRLVFLAIGQDSNFVGAQRQHRSPSTQVLVEEETCIRLNSGSS